MFFWCVGTIPEEFCVRNIQYPAMYAMRHVVSMARVSSRISLWVEAVNGMGNDHASMQIMRSKSSGWMSLFSVGFFVIWEALFFSENVCVWGNLCL